MGSDFLFLFFYLPDYCAIFKPSSRLALSHQDFSLKSDRHIFSSFPVLMLLQSSFLPFPPRGLLPACCSLCCPPLAEAEAGGEDTLKIACFPPAARRAGETGLISADARPSQLSYAVLFCSFPLPSPRGGAASPKVLSLAWTSLMVPTTSPQRPLQDG